MCPSLKPMPDKLWQILKVATRALSAPVTRKSTTKAVIPNTGSTPQMPTYHLKRANGNGIILINIGVGPSNAKTATDHIAVLRSHAWMTLGHFAGLRNSQSLGDFVLAHAYLRQDKVLDADLPF